MDQDKVVFLVDVDNTLLDNDRIISDLVGYLEREVGHDCKQRYWTIFEEMRNELGYADYLGALQRYRVENPRDHQLFAVLSCRVSGGGPYFSRLPGGHRALEEMGTNGHSFGWRRCFPAAED